MNLYLINAPIGNRIVLGINKRDAVQRLKRCHSSTWTIEDHNISEYTGTPEILTNPEGLVMMNKYKSAIVLHCTGCKKLNCFEGANWCDTCKIEIPIGKRGALTRWENRRTFNNKKRSKIKTYYPQIKNK